MYTASTKYIPLCPQKRSYFEHYLLNFEKSISNDLVWFRITFHEPVNFRFKLTVLLFNLFVSSRIYLHCEFHLKGRKTGRYQYNLFLQS